MKVEREAVDRQRWVSGENNGWANRKRTMIDMCVCEVLQKEPHCFVC